MGFSQQERGFFCKNKIPHSIHSFIMKLATTAGTPFAVTPQDNMLDRVVPSKYVKVLIMVYAYVIHVCMYIERYLIIAYQWIHNVPSSIPNVPTYLIDLASFTLFQLVYSIFQLIPIQYFKSYHVMSTPDS